MYTILCTDLRYFGFSYFVASYVEMSLFLSYFGRFYLVASCIVALPSRPLWLHFLGLLSRSEIHLGLAKLELI